MDNKTITTAIIVAAVMWVGFGEYRLRQRAAELDSVAQQADDVENRVKAMEDMVEQEKRDRVTFDDIARGYGSVEN